MNAAIEFAHEALDMQVRILELEAEITRLMWFEVEYHKLLDSSIKHNEHMVGQIFKLALTPGVVEACQAAAQGE